MPRPEPAMGSNTVAPLVSSDGRSPGRTLAASLLKLSRVDEPKPKLGARILRESPRTPSWSPRDDFWDRYATSAFARPWARSRPSRLELPNEKLGVVGRLESEDFSPMLEESRDTLAEAVSVLGRAPGRALCLSA